eukprot:Em0009g548a
MSGLYVKVILLFTLLETALAFRTLGEAEANSPSTDLTEIQHEELELTLQQDRAQLMLMYAKIAEELAKCNFVVDHFFDTLWKHIRDHRDTDAEILCQAVKTC